LFFSILIRVVVSLSLGVLVVIASSVISAAGFIRLPKEKKKKKVVVVVPPEVVGLFTFETIQQFWSWAHRVHRQPNQLQKLIRRPS
jgi:hypothetical protein